MNQLPIGIIYKKQDGKLVPVGDVNRIKEELYFNSLKENDEVQAIYEIYDDTGTNLQISKLKVGIRQLAADLGEEFKDMQDQIKSRSNLITPTTHLDGIYKSFGDCSVDELSSAIQAMINIG